MAEEQQPALRPHPDEPQTRPRDSQPEAPANEPRRGVLIAASRLLGYPDDASRALLPEIEAYLRGLSDATATRLAAVTKRLREAGAVEVEARYVATFEFSESTALYLTAHELGDSRNRGQALVELRAMLREAGFLEATEELPDYLPLLLEFLANAPEDTQVDALERRLAAVCERISTHLDPGSPYRDVFAAVLEVLPEAAEPNPERRFPQREKADTGEMPYPLGYD